MTPIIKDATARGSRAMTRGFVILFLTLAAFLSGPASAQNFAFNNVVIEGNNRVSDQAILTFAGISRGESVSAAELNAAGQRIRDSGLFEAVNIAPQGGTLRIDVVEFPTINLINIEGNSRIRDDELLPVISSAPRRVYSPAQAERDVAAIAAIYAQKGRINASVVPQIIRLDDNRVNLVFVVSETAVTEIERISFIGNRSYSERRLRGVLETKQAGLLRSVITRDTFSQERIGFDRQVLTDFYQSRGYADFQVLNVDVALTRERDAYLVTFNVQEGQQFRFGELTVVSEIPEPVVAEFQAAIATRPGTIYSPARVENDIARLERLAILKGLNFLAVEPRISRNDRSLTLDVTYALTRGPRIFVERIDIEGNNTTLDRVVRNQFRTVEGDPFNPREVRQAAERIRALGFFANANVEAREGSTPEQVVVDVDVVEQPTGSLSFGANYNTDTGVSLVASFREQNFLGRGQLLNFELSTAETNRGLNLTFAEPQFLGRDLRFGLSLNYRSTEAENAVYDTDVFRFSPSLTFPVSENGRLGVFYAVDYTNLSGIDPTDTTVSQVIREEVALGDITTQSVGYNYNYDSRRGGLNPNAGVVFRFGQEFGIGDTQFIKTSALVAAETKILNEELTLRATIEGGYLKYSEGDSRVTDRYFLGSRTMRGFEAGGIGPRDAATDDALGGNAFAVARLEAEFPIGVPEEFGITGGAFIDHGSVWDVGNLRGLGESDVLYNDFTPRTVAGLSIFWATPIGPLRFNFTEPLDVQDGDRTKNFDVTISTSF